MKLDGGGRFRLLLEAGGNTDRQSATGANRPRKGAAQLKLDGGGRFRLLLEV